jgi:hypothetical protein
MRDTIAIFSLALLFMMFMGGEHTDRQDRASAQPSAFPAAVSVL